MSIRYSQAIKELLASVPEFRGEYERLQADIFRDLPHPTFGRFTDFVVSLLANTKDNEDVLTRVFHPLEDLSSSEDLKTRALVQVSFLENLAKTPGALDAATRFMGPRTKALSRAIEEFWRTGRVDLLEAGTGPSQAD